MIKKTIARILIGAVDGCSLSAEERDFLSTYHPLGLTLFRRNIQDFAQLKSLNQDIQMLSGSLPAIISIDQEGGRVARIRNTSTDQIFDPVFDPGPAMKLVNGQSSLTALEEITNIARAQSEALLAIGINTNFAPVCDILATESTTCIGDRAFGRNPDEVTKRAGAFLAGMNQGGILSCLKHFPGQGSAPDDTHEKGSFVDKSLDELAAWELKPFMALLPKAPMVMLSHCCYPKVDANEVTRSSFWIRDFLQKKCGYQGLILSDDMTMGAMALSFGEQSWETRIVDSLLAGVEVLLVSSGFNAWQKVFHHLVYAAGESKILSECIEQAGEKINRLQPHLSRIVAQK